MHVAKPDHLTGMVHRWPRMTPANSRDLLHAVQLLVGGVAGHLDLYDDRIIMTVCPAAARGDLALVQLLLQRLGRMPSVKLLGDAAESGCEALLEWLGDQLGCLVGLGNDSHYAYVRAAKNGDRATLTALRRLGVPWGAEDLVVRAVGWGCPMPALQRLVKHRAPVGSVEAMERAVGQVVQRGALSAEEGAWLRGLAVGAVRHGDRSRGPARAGWIVGMEQQAEDEEWW